MHTLIKNNTSNKINYFLLGKLITSFFALFALISVPWDLSNPNSSNTVRIAIAVISLTIVSQLLKMKPKTFVFGLIIIGFIEVTQYNLTLKAPIAKVRMEHSEDLFSVKKTKYVNERITPFNESYFKSNPLSETYYAITGDYLQKDYCPSLRQDIISHDVQWLMEKRHYTRYLMSKLKQPIRSTLERFEFLEYKTYFVTADPVLDTELSQTLGHNTSKIRLTNNIHISRSLKDTFKLVTKSQIYQQPIISIFDPLNILPYTNKSLIPYYTVTNTFFSANKHQFIVNNFNDVPLWLIYADANNKHWRVYIDKRIDKIYPANIAFKAVLIPPGSHEVTFVYSASAIIYRIFIAMQILLAITILGLILFYPILAKKLKTNKLSREITV